VKSFAADLDALLTVAAAVLDADGVLLEANAGFLRLLPAAIATPIGAKISRFFIQPNFAALRASMNDTPSAGYRGLLSHYPKVFITSDVRSGSRYAARSS
jgi:hypothetical protein